MLVYGLLFLTNERREIRKRVYVMLKLYSLVHHYSRAIGKPNVVYN